MQVHFSVFQPDRIAHLSYVTQGSVYTTSESEKDISNLIEDIWTLHEQVIQAHASELWAAVPYQSHWGCDRVWVRSDMVTDVPHC